VSRVTVSRVIVSPVTVSRVTVSRVTVSRVTVIIEMCTPIRRKFTQHVQTYILRRKTLCNFNVVVTINMLLGN